MTTDGFRVARLGLLALATLVGLFVASVTFRWRLVGGYAAAALAHLPFVASVYWAVFRWNGLWRPMLLGWATFVLSAVLWHVAYALLYRRLGLPSPDLPGEVLVGIPFGWAPAAGMTCIAEISKNPLKRWFLGRKGRDPRCEEKTCQTSR